MTPSERNCENLRDQFVSQWFAKQLPQSLTTAEQEADAARSAFGPEHPMVVRALFDVAMAQEAAGQKETSEATLITAHDMLATLKRRAARTPDAPETAALLIFEADRMANIIGDDAQDVLHRYQEALAIREKHFGPDHVETAEVLARLAEVLFLRGNIAEAELPYRRAFTIYERSHDLDQPRALKCCKALAETLVSLERLGEAIPFFQKALVLCDSQNAGKQILYQVLIGYAGCLEKSQKIAEAEELRAHAQDLLPTSNPGKLGFSVSPSFQKTP